MFRSACLTLLALTALADRGRAAEVVHEEAAGASEILGEPLRAGAFVGWHATGDLDVVGERIEGNEPDSGPAFGVRLGLRAAQTFGLDLTAGAIPAGSQWLVPLLLEGRWRPLAGSWTPTIAVGAGVYVGLGKGGDVDALLDAALGVEVMLGRGVALRVEGALWMSDGIESALAFSPIFTVGVDLLAYRPRRASGPSTESKPLAAVKGCPSGVPPERCGNSDGDAFIDAYDRCPLVAGDIDGCSDDDADGVIGPRDGCPARRGAAIDWGCPR